MLVEEHDRGKIVPCLICKTPIRVGDSASNSSAERQDRPELSPKIRPVGKYAQ
ncbi:hypothetical protein [Zavarzinella formosa]|uniref:hypothetical protein n=1 Tax=Zavarzinella formosa TaxID=360055 RepID=UPI0012F8ED67|nr:hypothetical protein [Zavarzinella formosa]